MNKQFSIPSKFELIDNNENLHNTNFKKVKLYIQSDGVNYNGSSFTIDSMQDAMKTIDYIPILGYIKESDGEYDFDGHNVSYDIHVDSNGETTIYENFEEVPIGVITSKDCHIEYVDDKNFLVAFGFIWKSYSNKGISILERDIEKEVSMEISVFDGDFDDKGIFAISKYEIQGVTVLGQNVPAAIEGSKIQMSFSKNNEYKEKVKELDELLKSFNLKGGDNMDNEVEKNVEPQEEFTEDDAVEIPVIMDEQPQEFAEEEQDEEDEEVCLKCGKPLDECVCDENEEEEEMACGKKKKKKKCSCEDEKIYSQSELDEAVSNAKAEFSDVLKELAELREFKAEYDRQVELARLNESMDELVANFNVNEEKVNELREKVINGDYSLEKFELELYRNNQVVTKKDFSKEDKKTLPIIDVEDKKSEVDKLFDFYGIPKRDK